ncbi:MAG: 4-alpha-glucanotransferase [Chloroflexaceae bacterium]|nr:4-alpha-glucanotransferase [Chloroflexaceae bacterium]
MRFPRSSGILLHPTSLPGRWGIGDLGPSAYQFVDFLVAAGQRLWQILPLGPTGYGDSPYQCFSAFAGNPLLVSLDILADEGLLDRNEVEGAAASYSFDPAQVDFGSIIPFKMALLQRSFEQFQADTAPQHREQFNSFAAANAYWLEDYALFMAVKAAHDGQSWDTWETDIATRQPEAMATWRERLAEQIAFQQYLQYLFFRQWLPLKAHANQRGIKIIGDTPIFVAYDSADAWANRDLFYLDEAGRPTVVAGVPPSALTTVDMLRIDHFRGFAAYWEIPASEPTAIKGRWVEAPGAELFAALHQALGDLPLIAEDLGIITPDVEALRDGADLPGMKVLQFAFDGKPENLYLPHNYMPNCVVYTGTHDNDTTLGWFSGLSEQEQRWIWQYLGSTPGQPGEPGEIAWHLVRLAFASVADVAVVPLQDVLRLGSEARMNTPGKLGGNWGWRFRAGDGEAGLIERLHTLTETYGRLAAAEAEQ